MPIPKLAKNARRRTVKKLDWRIIITALICLTILEIFALMNDIDGAMFMAIVVIIAGIAGFEVKDKLIK